jgi:hypothetical protein
MFSTLRKYAKLATKMLLFAIYQLEKTKTNIIILLLFGTYKRK